MTRAGEKLYREPDDMPGSVLWALATHPETQRGFRDVARVLGIALFVVVLFGLG
jgi:hypothetical protein